MTAIVKVRPRLSQGLGLDQLYLAKLVQVLLEGRDITVEFQLVPRGIVGTEFIGMFGIDFSAEGMDVEELRSCLTDLAVQSVWERPCFSELRAGSTSDVRRAHEREVAELEVFYRPAADEWGSTASYGGPACAAFEGKAANVLGYVEDTIRRRLWPGLRVAA